MNPNTIHLLKQNWDEHEGKVHSMYYFRGSESLSANAETPSWIGAGCMVFEHYSYCEENEQPGYFKARQTRWWGSKEPMHPELVLYRKGAELSELLSNIQNSQKQVVVDGTVYMVNVIWNIDPER